MLRIFKNIFSIISFPEKIGFIYLQLLIFFICILELLNIFLLYVFSRFLVDANFLFNNKYFILFFSNFDFKTNDYIKIVFFLLIIGVNLFNIIINLYINWRSTIFCERVYQDLSNKLYLKHISSYGISSFSKTFEDYTKVILYDLTEIKIRVLAPLVTINHKIFLIFFLSTSIFIFSPKVFLFSLVILIFSYWLLFKAVKKISLKIIEKSNSSVGKKIRILNESFSGFREIVLLGLQGKFFSKFKTAGLEIEYYTGIHNILSYLPRLFIEFLVFFSIIGFLFYLSESLIIDATLLPLVITAGFAGLKIIPALNQVYFNLISIRNGLFFLNKFKKEFNHNNSKNKESHKNLYVNKKKKYSFKKKIELKEIFLKHDDVYALRNLSIKLINKQIIGITGPSGSGKSSLVDVIVGFAKPTSGKIFIDNGLFKRNLIKNWQQNFFLVTQNIFFSNATIAENIAFGLDLKKININKVKHVSKLLQLDQIIEKLPEKYLHKINDLGIGFSNGERQRISLARALYFEKKVLILDEATNALDTISENLILETIKKISKNKTIILITHRLHTLKICNQIIVMNEGSPVFQGQYKNFVKNKNFYKNILDF
jgi:HlyD family secretion protein